MRYLQPSFTLPTSERVSQQRWDEIFLSPEQFQQKYSENTYPRLTSRLAMDGIWPRPACVHDPAGLLETCDMCGSDRGTYGRNHIAPVCRQ